MVNSPIVNKSLSIRVCSNGLSFCTYSPSEEEPFCYREWEVNHTISLAANLKEALTTDEMLRQDYQRVNVMVTTPHFTTVPVEMFDKDKVADFYNCVFPKDTPRHISYNVLRRSGIAIIFGLDRNVYQLLRDDFPRARFYASASTLIEHFASASLDLRPLSAATKSANNMYAYIHEKEVTLYAFSRGRMQYVNNFAATNTSDIQYYVLNVWKELDFSQLDDSLHIVGDIDSRCQDLASKIAYFLQNVEVIDHGDDFRDKLTAGHSHIPYDLQTLLICGF